MRFWRALPGALALLLTAGLEVGPPAQAKVAAEVAARLTEAERTELEAYETAESKHRLALDAYWRTVAAKRQKRRAKAKKGVAPAEEDFVTTEPPEYAGPALSEALQKRLADIAAEIAKAGGEAEPAKPAEEMPRVEDYLKAAAAAYGFVPELVSEPEFKRRYAIEALALGLTRDQIVRVYALETGGRGTFDMQSGIDPATRTGKPISSAIGYAQLLGANSVGELGRKGEEFVRRLEAMAAQEGVEPARAEVLKAKAALLRRMVRDARRAGDSWARHVAFSGTRAGMAMHMWNLDGDVGPWLQVNKLHALTVVAAERGLASLTGGELELLNLAGPGSGLEMLSPIAQDKPTTNFFERKGWERNPVVQKRTAAELLKKLDERIDAYMQKPEAVAFAAVFDELAGVAAAIPAAASSTPATAEGRK